MVFAYDHEGKLGFLFATPAEMRNLADAMEQKLATALPGESLTVANVEVIHGWTNEPLDFTMRISAQQWEGKK